jgi:hypothetical protein
LMSCNRPAPMRLSSLQTEEEAGYYSTAKCLM